MLLKIFSWHIETDIQDITNSLKHLVLRRRGLRRHEGATHKRKLPQAASHFVYYFHLLTFFIIFFVYLPSDCNRLVFSSRSDGFFYDDRQGSLRRTERSGVLRDTAILRESGRRVGKYSPKDIFKAFTDALFETHRNLANLLYIKVLNIVNGRCSRV